MGRVLSFIGLITVVAVGMYLYSKQVASLHVDGANGNPKSTINLVGVKGDLLTLAKAEQQHMASEGRYLTLAEMRAAGDTGLPEDSRGLYHYSIETTGNSFTIVATYSGTPPQGVPSTLRVNETGSLVEQP